jgi:hypothetical protein
MTNRTTEPARSPQRVYMRYARVAGALYIPAFLLGLFSLLYVRATLIAPGDAAAPPTHSAPTSRI